MPPAPGQASIEDMRTVYDAVGGNAGLLALARAWHERCLADEVMEHPFSHGTHPEHLERLAAYWAEALGGPATFTATIGHEADVLRMHAGNGTHRDMDHRAVECFDGALTDVGLVSEPLRTVLHDYFAWSTQRMGMHPDSPDTVPDDESLPHWDWGGRVR